MIHRCKAYHDTEDMWVRVREIADDGAVLVRPDNYVAWRSMSLPTDPADILIEAVGTILQPTRVEETHAP